MTRRRPPLVIEVPAPCAWITSNDRRHFRATALLAAEWRRAGHFFVPAGAKPYTRPVRVLAHVFKNRSSRYDPGNWYPTAKAVVDGLVDAHLLEDDDFRHVAGPDMRHGGWTKTPKLVLTILDRDVTAEPHPYPTEEPS